MRPMFLPAYLPTWLQGDRKRWTTPEKRAQLLPLMSSDDRLRGQPGYYPHMLISYAHWRSSKFSRGDNPDRVKYLMLPEDGFVFGDSGAFSILTLGIKVDPRDVMRWQIKYCEVGAILDIPPRGKSRAGGMKSTWAKALPPTLKNVRAALPGYMEAREEGSEFRWWGVCHGTTVEALEEWYYAVADIYPFSDPGEGWAFKPWPINAVNTAWVLGFVAKRNLYNAHFLMATGLESVIVLAALGPRTGVDLLSYDSSSPGTGGGNRRCMTNVPGDDLRWGSLYERERETKGKDTKVRDYLIEHCECPSCAMMRADLKIAPNLFHTNYMAYRIVFHNQLKMQRVFDAIFAAGAEDGEALLRDRLGKQAGAVLRAFEGKEPPRGVEQGTATSLFDFL